MEIRRLIDEDNIGVGSLICNLLLRTLLDVYFAQKENCELARNSVSLKVETPCVMPNQRFREYFLH